MGPEKITFREIRDRLYILEKAYESKSDNLQELSSRLHTIRCILQRTFAAGDPKCTSSTSCVDLAHTVASRLTLLEAEASMHERVEEVKGILKEAFGKDWVFPEKLPLRDIARAVVDRLKVKSAECDGENEVVSNILKSSMRPDFPWGDMSTAAIASVVLLRISELSRVEERQGKQCGELFSIGIELTNAKVPKTGPGEKDGEPAERSILNRVQWLIKKKHELEMDNSVLEKRVTVLLKDSIRDSKEEHPRNGTEAEVEKFGVIFKDLTHAERKLLLEFRNMLGRMAKEDKKEEEVNGQ